MKSFATTAVALLGMASSASALFSSTNSSIFGNQAGSDLGCFNTFESGNSQAIDVCLIGILGGAFFIYFIGPSLGMNVDTQGLLVGHMSSPRRSVETQRSHLLLSERYGYDNAYNYEQQRGDLGKHPFANSGNIVAKAVSK